MGCFVGIAADTGSEVAASHQALELNYWPHCYMSFVASRLQHLGSMLPHLLVPNSCYLDQGCSQRSVADSRMHLEDFGSFGSYARAGKMQLHNGTTRLADANMDLEA